MFHKLQFIIIIRSLFCVYVCVCKAAEASLTDSHKMENKNHRITWSERESIYARSQYLRKELDLMNTVDMSQIWLSPFKKRALTKWWHGDNNNDKNSGHNVDSVSDYVFVKSDDHWVLIATTNDNDTHVFIYILLVIVVLQVI